MKLLISACLLGEKVRFDGKDNLQSHERLTTLLAEGRLIPVCPEVAGGLGVPRLAAEIQNKKTGIDVLQGNAKVLTLHGIDVTENFIRGAEIALKTAQTVGAQVAILKARSPSCGSITIYDGTFTRSPIPGYGVTAALLIQHGVKVFDEDHIEDALAALELNAS